MEEKKSRVLAIANVKGGVGKTTAVANLGAALVERGRVVLAVDLDPQASLTVSLGFQPDQLPRTIRHALDSSGVPITSIMLTTRENFDLVPAEPGLNRTSSELEKTRMAVYAIRGVLEPIRDRYDYVLIDCPANAGILTGAALAAADEVIIPVTTDYLGYKSLEWLLVVIKQVQQTVNPSLRLGGIFYSMFDPRTRHARETIGRLQSSYGTEIPFFATTIYQSVRMKEASAAGKTILQYAPDSLGAGSFRALALEIDEGIRESTENELYFVLEHGKEAYATNDLTSAYSDFCRATSLDPHLVDAWMGRAASAPAWDEAVRCHGRALQLQPLHKPARISLTKILNEKIYSATISDIPELMIVAHYLSEMGETSYAEALYGCVTELDPVHEEAWVGRARTTQNFKDAVAYSERCLEINPTNAQGQAALALGKARLKEEARRLVEEGKVLERSSKRAEAHACYKQAVELDPTNEFGWLGCARTSDNFHSISDYAKKALEIDIHNEEARELRHLFRMPEAEKNPKTTRPS